MVTQVLDAIEEFAGTCHTNHLDNICDKPTQRLLGYNIIEITQLIGDDVVNDDTSYRSFYNALLQFAVYKVVNHHLHLGMEVATALVMGNDSLLRTIERESFALGSGTQLGDVIKTEHHILRGHSDRSAIGRVKDVVALKHQYLRLQHSLIAQGEVNGHLVTIEVGIECRTCQWVQLYSLTLDKLRLEGLDTQTVKRRSTVEQNRMTLHHMLKDIPDDGVLAVHNLLGTLHRLHDAALNEFTDDEWLVELSSHQLRQTTLSHLELRTYYNHRTC